MAQQEESNPFSDSLVRSRLYQARAQARASLQEPTRPVTPHDKSRHLFRTNSNSTDAQRPNSAFHVNASNFLGGEPVGPSPRPSRLGASEVLDLSSPKTSRRSSRGLPPAAAEAVDDGQHKWWVEVNALLEGLEPTGSTSELCRACESLWKLLRPPVAAGVSGPPDCAAPTSREVLRRRTCVEVSARRLMDRREPELLLHVCRLVLSTSEQPAEANMGSTAQTNAIRLLSKLSKVEKLAEGEHADSVVCIAVDVDASVRGYVAIIRPKLTEQANDSLFLSLELLPLLLQVLQPPAQGLNLSDATSNGGAPPQFEAMLHAAGALKNVSNDADNQRALAKMGAVSVLSPLLGAQVLVLGEADGAAARRATQLLVTMSVVLRNISVSSSVVKEFLSSGCLGHLCAMFEKAPQHADLCLNASRVLAKLSIDGAVVKYIEADAARVHGMIRAIGAHPHNDSLLVRVCFVLGNLAASSSRNRRAITSSFALLLSLLRDYAACAPAARPSSGKSVSSQSSSAVQFDSELTAEASERMSGLHEASESDRLGELSLGAAKPAAGMSADRVSVLVKLVRLIAHLAIDEETGAKLGANQELGILIDLLEAVPGDGLAPTTFAEEELQLNILSALTNLTYYEDESNCLLHEQVRLCRLLVPLLLHPNEESKLEAARTLGNLARQPEARNAMCKLRAPDALLMLLEHLSPAVAEGACGALVNLAADSECRAALLGCDALRRLADGMAQLAEATSDACAPASLVLAGKTLCNLLCVPPASGASASGAPCALEAETAQLLWGVVESESVAMLVANWTDDEPKREWPQVADTLRKLLTARWPVEMAAADARGGSASRDILEEIPAPHAEYVTVSTGV